MAGMHMEPEYSARARIEICEAKWRIKMYKGVLWPEKMQVNESDVIISSETIEHINKSKKRNFSNIYKHASERPGCCTVTTPNFQFLI
jgi:hypothetical protein